MKLEREIIMKKLLVFILTGITIFSLAACGQNNTGSKEPSTTESTAENNTKNDVNIGGYERASSPIITDNIKNLLEKATENLVGAKYTPVAYIARQVVSGTNHCILCKITAVTPDAKATYALVYLYEDLEGNTKITDTLDSMEETATPNLVGGWNETESPIVTKEAKAALEKATEGLTGEKYVPVALLASQVVSGTNYCILCEVSTISPDAEAAYMIVYVYEDLKGNSSITETVDFNVSTLM